MGCARAGYGVGIHTRRHSIFVNEHVAVLVGNGVGFYYLTYRIGYRQLCCVYTIG